MNNYSYVTYLTDDSYAYGVVLLISSMEKVKTKYQLHVLITEEVSAPTIEILKQLNVTYELVDIIPIAEHIQNYNNKLDPNLAITWRNCWTQFKVFDLTQFDKVVFLDADIMILKNLDHLFDLPHMTAAIDGEYFNIWPDCPHFNTGCMVIEPNHEEFEDIVNFANNFNPQNHWREEPIANQEILNNYYSDWMDKEELHLNKYYDIFASYVLQEHVEDLKNKTYFIHFIGRKPWVFWVNNEDENYYEGYYYEARDIIQEYVNKLNWKTIQQKVVLTVYGICKNEIKSIKNYLESFGKADYVCILDTGSTDGTWEFLQEAQKEYNNLIIEQEIIDPWRFDTARNRNMEIIPKDTVMYFMADMDEVIKENDWVDKVKGAWSPAFHRAVYAYNREVDENDVVQKHTIEYRIHSKDWNKWVNVVHEALVNIYGEKYFYQESATPIDITVWHYSTKKEPTNYAELCENALKENPDDWVMHLQLAIEYDIRDEMEKAYNEYDFLLRHPNTLQPYEMARCFCGVARFFEQQRDIDTALYYLTEGRLVDNSFADNYLSAARIYSDNNEFEKSNELCKAALNNCYCTEWCGSYDIHSYYPYFLLSMNYYNLGQLDRALGYIELARIKNPIEDLDNIKQNLVAEIIKV